MRNTAAPELVERFAAVPHPTFRARGACCPSKWLHIWQRVGEVFVFTLSCSCRTSPSQQARQAASARGQAACSASTVQRAWHHPRLPCSDEGDPLAAGGSDSWQIGCQTACGRLMVPSLPMCHACITHVHVRVQAPGFKPGDSSPRILGQCMPWHSTALSMYICVLTVLQGAGHKWQWLVTDVLQRAVQSRVRDHGNKQAKKVSCCDTQQLRPYLTSLSRSPVGAQLGIKCCCSTTVVTTVQKCRRNIYDRCPT